MEYTFDNIPDILEKSSLSGYSCVVEDKPLSVLQELFDKMKKLTTKQLTEVVSTQNAHINSLLGLINTYIEFKGDGEGFKGFLKERAEKQKAK